MPDPLRAHLTLGYPPSMNRYWRHPTRGALAGRHLISAEGRAYRAAVQAAALAQGVRSPLTGRLDRLVVTRGPVGEGVARVAVEEVAP